VSSIEVVPLRLRHDKTCALMKRFGKLPKMDARIGFAKTWKLPLKTELKRWR